jgi:hypothetical protein
MPPAARPGAPPSVRAHEKPVRSGNSTSYYPNDLCCAVSRPAGARQGGAFGSGGRTRAGAGKDVTAANVAFAVVLPCRHEEWIGGHDQV